MNYTDAISLFIIMFTLALLPSSSVVLVVTRSITHGVANGISVAMGIVLGDLIFIFLAVLGLSVIAETMSWLFVTIKYVGACYLFYLGYTLLTSKTSTSLTVESSKQTEGLLTSLIAGLLLTLGDIKAIFFYVSLFPTFVNLDALSDYDVLVILFVTIITVGGAKIMYAFMAVKLSSLTHLFGFEKVIKKISGGFMLGVGSYLIIKT